MSDSYTLTLPLFATSHYGDAVWLVADRSHPRDPKLDAYVRSGDYFVMLATTLENLAAELPETSVVATSLALARLADELFYIQKHYAVTPKKHSDELTELS